MNKIKDFKINNKFDSDGLKFSLCLESEGLSCQIPNLYKTFCDGSIDPTKDTKICQKISQQNRKEIQR